MTDPDQMTLADAITAEADELRAELAASQFEGAACAWGFVLRLIEAGTPIDGLRVIAEAMHHDLTQRARP